MVKKIVVTLHRNSERVVSSSGPGRWPLTPETGVRLPVPLLRKRLADFSGPFFIMSHVVVMNFKNNVYLCVINSTTHLLFMELNWVDGFVINVEIHDGEVVLSANKEGLLSLANHIVALSECESGSHVHLDKYNSLEGDSIDLIIEKID